jgi:hypothetical protein
MKSATGANPTIASYNASIVNFYNAMGSLTCDENNFLNSTLKNAVAYYNAGVVAVNLKVVGLAPGLFCFSTWSHRILELLDGFELESPDRLEAVGERQPEKYDQIWRKFGKKFQTIIKIWNKFSQILTNDLIYVKVNNKKYFF